MYFLINLPLKCVRCNHNATTDVKDGALTWRVDSKW